MAVRLPDANALGRRPIPQGNQGFAQQDTTAPGRAVAQLGQTIGAAGERVGDAIQVRQNEEQKKQAETEYFNARRQLNEWEASAINDPEKGAASTQMQDAFGVSAKLSKSFDEMAAKVSSGLTTDRSKKAFSELAETRKNQTLDWASRHEVQARRAYGKVEFKANIDSSIERAARIASMPGDGTPSGAVMQSARVKSEIEIGQEQIVSHMRNEGMPGEAIAAATKDFSSAVHENVIRTMQQSDPVAAQAYFEANKKAINATRWDEIGKPLQAMNAALAGDTGAEEIWARLGPKSDLQPVQIDKMEAEARKKFAGDKPRMDAAIDGIRQRAQAFNASERERSSSNTNAVFGMLDSGKGFAAIARTPEWNALPEKDQRQIRLSVESEAATRANRLASEASRAFTNEQRADRSLMLRNGDAYLVDSDPERLAAMKRDDVVALRAKYGMDGAQHLLSRWDALQKPGAVAEAKIDQDEFNSIADAAKMNPYDQKKTDKEKESLGRLKATVERRIDMEQQGAKRTLTRPEKAKIMQEEIDNKVMLDVWGTDPSKSVAVLSGDELGKAYVMVEDKKVMLSSIPTEDRAQIMRARLSRGLPVTEADIAKTWVRGRAKATDRTGAF